MKYYARLFSMATVGLIAIVQLSCAQANNTNKQGTKRVETTASKNKATAVFASGCFWCTVHIFEAIPGLNL